MSTMLLAGLVLAAGCKSRFADCDMPRAKTVVYDDWGAPAYEGQALLIRNCGGGSFCHISGSPQNQLGAPAGLDFNLTIAALTPDWNKPDVDRLGVAQLAAHTNRELIYDQVRSGQMPPPGSLSQGVVDGAPSFDHRDRDPNPGTPLAAIDSSAGRAALRNWLACGAPVIERTQFRADGQPNDVGDTVQSLPPRVPLEARWADIYERLVQRTCVSAQCHNTATNAGGLKLDGGPDAALAELINRPATSTGTVAGVTCATIGTLRVVPADPAHSLLVQKLEGRDANAIAVCGERMPSGVPLSASTIQTLRTWITNGATRDESCATNANRCASFPGAPRCDATTKLCSPCTADVDCAAFAATPRCGAQGRCSP